jgi:hypothetical protein
VLQSDNLIAPTSAVVNQRATAMLAKVRWPRNIASSDSVGHVSVVSRWRRAAWLAVVGVFGRLRTSSPSPGQAMRS